MTGQRPGRERCVALLAMVGLVLASCSSGPDDGSAPSPTATAPTTTSATDSVVRVADVAFATVPSEEWKPPLLDVYAPEGATDLPLVVLFHGGSSLEFTTDKASLVYPTLARAIARRGAVVVVPNWGADASPMDMLASGSSASQSIDFLLPVRDQGACAVSFAVSHADEYGADPNRIVLVGNSAGANQASMVALADTSPLAGCAVPPAEWAADGLLLWEGDWLLEDPSWDVFGKDLPALAAVFTPWDALDAAPAVDVELAVSATSREELKRCPESEGFDWLVDRDPTGSLRSELETSGALADGCVDIGEQADLLAAAMNERGLSASILTLADLDSGHAVLSEADLALMADHIVALAGQP